MAEEKKTKPAPEKEEAAAESAPGAESAAQAPESGPAPPPLSRTDMERLRERLRKKLYGA